jgi:hypothetical protein
MWHMAGARHTQHLALGKWLQGKGNTAAACNRHVILMVHITDCLPEIKYRMHNARVASICVAIYNVRCHRQKRHSIIAMTGEVFNVTNCMGVVLRVNNR